MSAVLQFVFGDFRLSSDLCGRISQLWYAKSDGIFYDGDAALDLNDGRLLIVGGWNECFPTIEPIVGSRLMGDLVGVLAKSQEVRDGGLVQEWETKNFNVQRTLNTPEKGVLKMTFRATNASSEALEFLWASHPAFQTDTLQRLEIGSDWSCDHFRVVGTCSKEFVRAGAPARFVHSWGEVIFSTDQPHWGIWLQRGGWPAGNPQEFSAVAVEPTSNASERPGGHTLQPGETFEGSASLLFKIYEQNTK